MTEEASPMHLSTPEEAKKVKAEGGINFLNLKMIISITTSP
jgi:hypothetical protein